MLYHQGSIKGESKGGRACVKERKKGLKERGIGTLGIPYILGGRGQPPNSDLPLTLNTPLFTTPYILLEGNYPTEVSGLEITG